MLKYTENRLWDIIADGATPYDLILIKLEFTQEIENFEGIMTSLELRKLDLEVQKRNTEDPRLISIIINLVSILD